MNKSISLISIIALLTFNVHAQQGISFGLRGGVNFQNLNGQDVNGDDLKNDLIIGFNFGINAEIPIAPEFYFQPGLLFTTKGAKKEDFPLGQSIKSRINISYIELPLNLLFKPILGNGHILLGLGPYIAYGISGNSKQEGGNVSHTEDITFKNKVSIGDPSGTVYIKALDFGANLFAGYAFSNNLSFQLNAQLGLSDINPEVELNTNDKSSVKNTGFGFSLGYKF